MQVETKQDDAEWKSILKLALSHVYKHKHTDEFERKLRQLIDEHELDTSGSKVHFVQAYMEIVAKIPPEQINLAFHR